MYNLRMDALLAHWFEIVLLMLVSLIVWLFKITCTLFWKFLEKLEARMLTAAEEAGRKMDKLTDSVEDIGKELTGFGVRITHLEQRKPRG